MPSISLRSVLLFTIAPLFGCSPLSVANLADFEVSGSESETSSSSGSPGATTSATNDSEDSGGSTGWGTTDVTDTDGETDADTDSTTGEFAIVIDDHLLTPSPIEYNGAIAATVWSDSADGVRMELDDGSVVELIASAPGVFEGEILALTGLINGEHDAVFTPWSGDAEGEPVIVTYEIALGTPGEQGLWETGNVIGIGRVPAMAVLPSTDVLEFGSLLGNGSSRCYVRRRTKGGAWSPDDLLYLLPDVDCRAVDLEVDEEGAIFFLLETETNTGWRWSLHKMGSWGAPLESIGYGSQDETANALARSPGEGALAVCGAAPTILPTDTSDAMVRVFREDNLGLAKEFDHIVDGEEHLFDERANGCEFLDDETLVVVGEAFGYHDKVKKVELNRRFDLFYDLGTNSGEMRVAAGGLVLQSVASDVDIDADTKMVVIVGHICDLVCEPEGQIWTLNAQGDAGWSASLGLHAIEAFAPHAVRSSPAGYAVVASGGLIGSDAAFTIRAFAPGESEPLWIYSRNDADLLHIALTVAIGHFGEVYAGGLGANGYPSVAYIFG